MAKNQFERYSYVFLLFKNLKKLLSFKIFRKSQKNLVKNRFFQKFPKFSKKFAIFRKKILKFSKNLRFFRKKFYILGLLKIQSLNLVLIRAHKSKKDSNFLRKFVFWCPVEKPRGLSGLWSRSALILSPKIHMGFGVKKFSTKKIPNRKRLTALSTILGSIIAFEIFGNFSPRRGREIRKIRVIYRKCRRAPHGVY